MLSAPDDASRELDASQLVDPCREVREKLEKIVCELASLREEIDAALVEEAPTPKKPQGDL